MSERFEADYVMECPGDPAAVAETMAREQSSGTFVPLPEETEDLKARAAARVERLDVLETGMPASLPGAAGFDPRPCTRARLTLSWPMDTIGPDLLNLMATVAGNQFELRGVTGLRLTDLRLPPAFASAGPGPRFGIRGTRLLSAVAEGPLIGSIVKPSVGFDAQQTAALAGTLAKAGIDFIKDDELQANGPACPFDARVRAVMGVLNARIDRSGKKVMYAFNVTGEIDDMRRRHDLVRDLGGTCVMVSLNSVGLAGLLALARHSDLPIHAHRNGWGYLSRAPMLGWDFTPWSKIMRIAGADHMHVNGLGNTTSESDHSVMVSARALQTPLFDGAPYQAMPVFSSGQTVHQPQQTFAQLGNADCIFAAGGAIMAHPDGPAAGVQSLRAAWMAAMAGRSAAQGATGNPALARAVAAFPN